MAKFDVEALVAPGLHTGEELLAWIRVNYSGQTAPPAKLRTGLAALGDTEPPRAEDLITFPAHRSMVLALTGGRILAYSLGVTGKPKQYLGDVPVSGLQSCELEAGRINPHITLVLNSQANVLLDVIEGQHVVFANELRASIRALHPENYEADSFVDSPPPGERAAAVDFSVDPTAEDWPSE